MSLFADFEPARLHKKTWAEKHDFEILVFMGIAIHKHGIPAHLLCACRADSCRSDLR